MNKKNKLYLLLTLGILFCVFFSCSDNNEEPENPPVYADLTDVSLKQTVNGKESFELTEVDEELNFSSQLEFNGKTINWSKPSLELSFSSLFVLSADNITVTDSKGATVTQAEVTIDQNTIKVSFTKISGSYSYLSSSTITISIKTSLKPGITDEELSDLNYSGFNTQSIFYGETQARNIKSNTVTVVSKINPDVLYDVKGDPNNDNYPYKLNVVYFVPSDIIENPGYKKRISTLLLRHQLFVRKWMKYWGYAEKSFGLPLDENGMVDIVKINAKGKKADYPYDGGGSKMITEINEYYTQNSLTKYSEHTLVLTAINGSNEDTPFYGLGKWCFAYEYEGMAYENMQRDPITGNPIKPVGGITNNSIGGMFHELGHALNEPHVGPTNSQKNNVDFGMSLMGAGNQTYGKTATFMHHASAAIMNNCQLSSFTKKMFYETVTASLKISGVEINGGTCTVKGSFIASVPVTDVIIRFYNASETFLGGSHGYTSVAFVAKPVGNTFQLDIPIEEMRVNNFDYRLGVTILMENGTAKSVSRPYTYHLVNTGGTYTFESEDIINDGSWSVTTSHPLPTDDAISNAPGSLVDGDLSTCLSMVKPGKSYGGVSVPATGQEVWAIIDFGKQMTFNTIVLTNRNFQAFLNTKAVSFYGSDDGSIFIPVKEHVGLPNATVNEITLDAAVHYRYLKMRFDEWDNSGGSTMQFAELGLKNKK